MPGDHFFFQRGKTWTGGITMPTHVNGTALNPIVITNYGSGALPKFDGGGRSTGAIAGFYARATGGGITPLWSYITIDGFEITNTSGYGIVFYQNAGGSIGMPGIVVQNMNIHATGPASDSGYRNQLMFLDENKGADGVQFLNNTVGNCGGHNCIQVQKDTGSPVVSGNLCYAPWLHNCIDLKSVVGAMVKLNTVNGAGSTTGSAFYTENVEIPASDVTFQQNVIYNNPPNGFECEWGGANSGVTTTCHIWNNTAYIGTHSAIATGGDPSCLNNVTIDARNNIFDTTSTYYVGHSCPPVSLTWDYNDDGASRGPVGGPHGAHDFNGVNPSYVNAAALNFQLNGGSACIGAGVGGLPGPNMGRF